MIVGVMKVQWQMKEAQLAHVQYIPWPYLILITPCEHGRR